MAGLSTATVAGTIGGSAKMNHYCTYADENYLVQCAALLFSLRRRDPGMTLWVLALDETAAGAVIALSGGDVRVVTCAELEADDGALASSRKTRSRIEHIFTMSPCLPRHILRRHPDIPAIIYLDADLWFFANLNEIHQEWAAGSLYLTRQDVPRCLREREERYGRYNVGILGFRNNATALACLDWWRERCLEWCKNVPEPGLYADQKYLDVWPERFRGVVVSNHPGINVAPWNWSQRQLAVDGPEPTAAGRPLIAFHFAQLRRLSRRCIDTNQVQYGVMPFRLRAPIYGQYIEALDTASGRLAKAGQLAPLGSVRPRSEAGLQRWGFAIVFGTVWVRLGRWWFSSGFGLGRHSGRIMTWQHRLRGKPA